MNEEKVVFENLDKEKELTMALYYLARSWYDEYKGEKSFMEELFSYTSSFGDVKQMEARLYEILGWD